MRVLVSQADRDIAVPRLPPSMVGSVPAGTDPGSQRGSPDRRPGASAATH